MYFVKRKKIEQILSFMETQIEFIESKGTFNTKEERLSFERTSQLMIDCIFDIGNLIIDGFIMRDPGSFEDIFDILMDEKVIANEMATGLKQLIPMRHQLIQNYLDLDNKLLQRVVLEQLSNIKQFPASVLTYLEKELGPVHAFGK